MRYSEMKETIQPQWQGYVDRNKTDKIGYRVWNGDRLASLILSGVLKQELLDIDYRVHFQKAVALVSEPEAAYEHFRALLNGLTEEIEDDRRGTTRLRRMMICLWILTGIALDAGNLEAPYKASELSLLHAWDALRRSTGASEAERKAREVVFGHVLTLYLTYRAQAAGREDRPPLGQIARPIERRPLPLRA